MTGTVLTGTDFEVGYWLSSEEHPPATLVRHAVLAERAKEIFEGEQESPFMLLAARVRPEWAGKIPAIVHVDGSARLQTVRREHNAQLHRLLAEVEKITGVPVLLNTSFNIRGEPIVETPDDALACFLTTGIDYLVVHDLVVAKNPFHRILAPFARALSEVSSIVRTGLTAEVQAR